MVHLAGGAGATVSSQDTTLVCVPSARINSDTDGAVLLEGRDGSIGILSAGLESLAGGGGVSPLSDGSNGVGRKGGGAGSCVSGSAGVRVVGLSAHASPGLDLVEGVGGKSSVAALVSVLVAAHEHLGGENGHVVSGENPGGLDGLGGGKCPARSALCLVLDGGELALVVPVVGSAGGVDNVVGLDDRHVRDVKTGINSKVEGELVLGPVSELGHSVDLVVSLLAEGSVLHGNLLHVGLEDLETLGVFGIIGVLTAVLCLERLETLGKEEGLSLGGEGVGRGHKGRNGKGELHDFNWGRGGGGGRGVDRLVNLQQKHVDKTRPLG